MNKQKIQDSLLDFFPIQIIHPKQNVQESKDNANETLPIVCTMMSKTQLDWIKIHR